MDRKQQDRCDHPPAKDKRPESTSDEELDDALDDSFPASDPPSSVSKGTTRNPNAAEREKHERIANQRSAMK
jgi:hypothetical protein